MKAIELKPTDLLAVVVPQSTKKVKISGFGYICYKTSYTGSWNILSQPNENWKDFEILGCITKDHIDFDVEKELSAFKLDFGAPYDEMYQYIKDSFVKHTYSSDEYFRSLLSSNGLYFVNPYGKECPKQEYFLGSQEIAFEASRIKVEQWQQAESQLTPKVLILKKLK